MRELRARRAMGAVLLLGVVASACGSNATEPATDEPAADAAVEATADAPDAPETGPDAAPDASDEDATIDVATDATEAAADAPGEASSDAPATTDVTEAAADATDSGDAADEDAVAIDAPAEAAPPTCSDGIQNHGESDVDCGGPCGRCMNGQACTTPADCWNHRCPNGTCAGCPDGMVEVPHPGGVATCIDATEVTAGEYAQFLAGGAAPSLPAQCAFDTSQAPHDSGNGCSAADYDPAGAPDLPVRCVDWCDAWAYCAASDKRICAQDAKNATPFFGWNEASASEWYAACSANGAHGFPYGDGYDAQTCVGGSTPVLPGPAAVASTPACVGGLPGLFDMSGNVFEWENSCDGAVGFADWCRMRGGSFAAIHDQDMRCDADYRVNRGLAYPTLGFRCCGG